MAHFLDVKDRCTTVSENNSIDYNILFVCFSFAIKLDERNAVFKTGARLVLTTSGTTSRVKFGILIDHLLQP
jgi:hypothetical protein